MNSERYLTKYIYDDLSEKMVFLGGARQVGKTTLAKNLLSEYFEGVTYLNWDNRQDRKRILNAEYQADSSLIIFDELHKYRSWKNLIKGEYDILKDKFKFVVTGSARLNIYRKGGDSLQGRYHYYTLHPFTLAELLENKRKFIKPGEPLIFSQSNNLSIFEQLQKFGGFPEVFLRGEERSLRRWHNDRNERLFREDIRDVETIRDISNMQLLSDILPEKVGSLLSLNSLREDIQVSHRAISSWINILESFYYLFRVYPYTSNKIRSLKKEAKVYLFDWSEVENKSARLENLIASHLLKFVHFLKENQGYKVVLNFLRNVDKKEVDFLISVDNKPWFCVEVKSNSSEISPNIFYFNERLRIPFSYQVVGKPNIDILRKGVRIISADKFLSALI